ncbi:unnamed protein product [Closterium sp. NIES-65]|nr:unnamed protein product [Closterium sp. NIES-65]
MQNSEPIALSPPSYPASLVLPPHSSSRRSSRRRPVARIVASIDVALAISRRGPPFSSRRHSISPLPSHRLSSPVAFPFPLPFLRRFPLPSPFLSRFPSSPVAFLSHRPSFSPAALPSLPLPFLSRRFPLPPPFFLSRRPSFSPVTLLSRRFLSRCPSYSPVTLPTLLSPFLLSRHPSCLPSPFLSPVAYSLSRRPSSLPSPFLSPVTLSFSRLLSSLPSHVFYPVAPSLPTSSLPLPFISPAPSPTSAHLRSPQNACSSFRDRRPLSLFPRSVTLPVTYALAFFVAPRGTLIGAFPLPTSLPSLSLPITLFSPFISPLLSPSHSSLTSSVTIASPFSPLTSPSLSPSPSPQIALPLSLHITHVIALSPPKSSPLPLVPSPNFSSHHPPCRLRARSQTPSPRPSSLPSHHPPRGPHARRELPARRLSFLPPMTHL